MFSSPSRGFLPCPVRRRLLGIVSALVSGPAWGGAALFGLPCHDLKTSLHQIPTVISAVNHEWLDADGENGILGSCLAWVNRRDIEQAARAAKARKISGRRRFVDPVTSDRDYSKDELEFMFAMYEYKRESGRMFPTWSEVLEVIRELGYEKLPASSETERCDLDAC